VRALTPAVVAACATVIPAGGMAGGREVRAQPFGENGERVVVERGEQRTGQIGAHAAPPGR
jgi:hypothetical protein